MANNSGFKPDESAWQNNKELNPQVNSAVTDDVEPADPASGDTSWRPADEEFQSPTSEEFDRAEAAKRNQSIRSDTPGLTPDIAE